MKRFFSLLLVFAMIVTMLPNVTVFANEEQTEAVETPVLPVGEYEALPMGTLSVQQTEEQGSYTYSIVPSDHGLYTIETYGELAASTTLYDENEVVIATDDDFRLQAYLEMGKVYTLVVEADGIGTLNLRAEQIPVSPVTVGGQKVNRVDQYSTVYVPFTAPEDGMYVFQSTADMDTVGTLYTQGMRQLQVNDDGGEGNNFRMVQVMKQGEIVVLGARFYDGNNSGTLPVRVDASSVESISVHDLTLMEMESGAFNQWDDESFYRYYWSDALTYDVITKDGSTHTFSGMNFYLDGVEYSLETDDDQSVKSPWTVGNTYEATVRFGGVDYPVNVTITESPVESVTVDPISVYQHTGGNFETAWDEKTQSYQPGKYLYDWKDMLQYTVTFRDGTVMECSGNNFCYNDTWYDVVIDTAGYYEAELAVGKNQMTFYVLGHETTVDVTVQETPIESISVEPVVMVKEGSGTWQTEWNNITETQEDYFVYAWTGKISGIVTMKDGTVCKLMNGELYYNGMSYSVQELLYQRPTTKWDVGSFNASAEVLGYEFAVPVEIRESLVESVVIDPIKVVEGSGYRIEKPDGRVFYRYNWEDRVSYTITMADGTVVQGSGMEFYYDGKHTSMNPSDDQSVDNQWVAGNTYYVTVETGDITVTVPVTVAECPVSSIVASSLTLMENTCGEQHEMGYYYNWHNELSYTVYMKNGDVVNGQGICFEYDGTTFYLEHWDNQSNTPWVAGYTYTGHIAVSGCEASVAVAIEESPFKALSVAPLRLLQETGGYWEGPGYFYYQWWNNLVCTVTLADDTTMTFNGIRFEYNGMTYELETGDNQYGWQPGGQYEVYVTLLGTSVTVPVEIVGSEIVNIQPHPLTIPAGSCGQLKYSGGNLRFVYEWEKYISYTVTFTDGTTMEVSGDQFTYNGITYNLEANDDQEHNYWQAGSMHEVYLDVPGCGVSAMVNISAADPTHIAYPSFQVGQDNQVNINEEYGIQVFSFVPTETAAYTFYSYHPESRDTYGYLLDSNFNVLMSNDDGNGNLQFRLDGTLTAGNVYYIAARFLNSSTGSFVVRMDKGLSVQSVYFAPITMYEGTGGSWEHSGSPSGGNYYRYYWWNKLNYTVYFSDGSSTQVSGNGGFHHQGRYYSVTPTDGQYETPWTVGTHTAYLEVAGVRFSLDVTLEESAVQSVKLNPVTVLENATGYETTRWDGELQQNVRFFRYYWWENIRYEITFKDGTVASGTGSGYNYDGSWTQFEFSDDGQYNNPWQAGKTYYCYVMVGSQRYEVPVYVQPVNVTSVVVDPIVIMENTCGQYNSSYSGDYYYYQWWNQLKATVTFADGTSIRTNGTYFTYKGIPGYMVYRDSQSAENPMVKGQTYTVGVSFCGYETEVQVSITDTIGGQAGENASWTLDSQGNFMIAGSGALYEYGSSGDTPWYLYREAIKTVTISEGITDLARFAFYSAFNLTTVTIADSVIDLGEYTFYNCVSLQEVKLGNGVQNVGSNCFAYCTNLQTVTLPTSLVYLGNWAFYPCSDLNRIIYLGTRTAFEKVVFEGHVGFDRWSVECVGVAEILDEGTAGDLTWKLDSDGKLTIEGEGAMEDYSLENPAPWASHKDVVAFLELAIDITTIGDYAFYDFDALRNMDISYVTEVGDYAFYDCDQITSFYCYNIRNVGKYAFYSAENMSYAAFTADLESIGAWAFADTRMSEVEYGGPGYQFFQHDIGEGNEPLLDAYFYACEEEGVIKSGRCGETAYWKLEENGQLTVWGEGAIFDFIYCDAPWMDIGYPIFGITIEEGITAIGEDAFRGMNNIRNLSIPGTVKTIGNEAFMRLGACDSVIIPEGVESIGHNAFAFSAMSGLQLPSTLRYIGSEAFRQCDCLTTINIPEGVEVIEDRAFVGCHALESIWVDEANAYFASDDRGVLFNKEQTVLVAAPGRIRGSYTVPETVETIGKYAFAHCTNLEEVVMGDNVTDIDFFAFNGCYGLSSVVFGKGLTEIKNGVFMEAGMSVMEIPEGITAIGAYAFQGCEHLSKVTIPETVTTIGEYAFAYCWNLTDVTLPSSVTNLGQYVFYKCDMLTEITVPEGITEIGEFAFADCMELTTVTLPESVETIGAYAFMGCTNLTEITMSDNVTSIGDSAFEGCVALTEVTIPAGVTELVYRMFAGCTSLENITIPETVESIGDMTFADCNTLTEVTVPDSVESIGDCAFKQCENLSVVNIGKGVSHMGGGVFNDSPQISAFRVHAENQFYHSDSYGALYEGTMLLRCPPKLEGEFVVAEGTEEFWENTFTDCTELTSVTIPGTVSFIPDFNFAGCGSLTSVTLEEGVEAIGYMAFANCYNLEEVVLPDSITWIECEAFRDCYSLQSVTIPAGMSSLRDYTFAGCGSLTEVTIPDSIQEIYYGAFVSCPIENIYYGGTRAEWMNISIHGDNNILYVANITYEGDNEILDSGKCGENLIWTLTVGGKLTVEGQGEMDYYGMFAAAWSAYGFDIREVEICEGVTSVGGAAFLGCYNLEKVTIPSTVSEIEHSAFQDCESLREINLADGLERIGYNAFQNCPMETISFPETLEVLEDRAFAYCNNLTSVILPASLTQLEGNPFYRCEKLNAIWVSADNNVYRNDEAGVVYTADGTQLLLAPTNMTGSYTVLDTTVSIAADAFAGCQRLPGISLPESLVTIGNNAFIDCTGLQDVYYAGSETSWNRDVTVGDNNDGIYNAQMHYAKVSNLGEGNCGDNATWVLNPMGTLTVSGTGAMFSELAGDYEVPWHDLRDEIKVVIIDEGITTVGSYAFMGCQNLTEVHLASTVRMIDIHGFYNCDSLEAINLPDSMMIIARSAFENSDNLRYVYGGLGLTQIQSYAFKDCGALETIAFCYGLRFIGNEAFLRSGLRSVCLPGTMEGVEDQAFAECTRLTEVTIEASNITELYYATFRHCTALEYVTLGNSITSLQDEVFYNCSALVSVILSDNITYMGANCFAECRKLESMHIPSGLREIADNTFYNCENLTYVNMNQVESIGTYAFYNTAITSVYTEKLQTIHTGAFASCHALNNVNLGNYVTEIGSNAFENCSSLISFVVPAGVSYIAPYTFAYCSSLETLDVPTSLSTVDYNAFVDCFSLTTVNYGGSLDMWDEIDFLDGNESLVFVSNLNCAMQPENYYYCQHCATEVTFEDWNCSASASGHYRLTQDIYSSQVMVGSSSISGMNIVLDLNGYRLHSETRAFTVYSGNSLTVIDTVGGGVISGGNTSAIGGAVLVSGGEFVMQGSTLTSNSNNSGGCVYVTNNGSFYMYGGQLIGGSLANGRRGGALYVGTDCYAEIASGLVTDGYARGASIYAAANSNLTIGDAIIGELLTGRNTYIYLYGEPVVEAMDLTGGGLLSFDSLGENTRITVYADDCFTNYIPNAESYVDYFTSGFEGTVIEVKDNGLWVTYPFEEEILELNVMESPYKTVYEQGEALDLTGLVLLAYYASGYEELVEEGYEVYGFNSQLPGIQEIAVSYGNVFTSFLVQVNEKRVVDVKLHTKPSITEYYVGEFLDTDGLVLHVTYSNGEEAYIADGYQLDVSQLYEVGTQTVTVSYEDFYVTFTVNVRGREVEILQQPESVIANEDDMVSFCVEANNVVSYRWQIDKHDGKGFYNTSFTGCKTDTLTFQATLVRSGYSLRCVLKDIDGNVTYTDEVTLEVIPAVITVTGLYITAMPEKLVYNQGEALDLTGLQLMATFSYGPDGEIVDGYTVSGFDSTVPGEQTITIAYEGAETQFTVTVLAPVGEIVSQPEDVAAVGGDNVTFTVGVEGEVASYQWQYSTGDGQWFNTTMSSSNSATLSLTATGGRNNYLYRCVVTFANGKEEISQEARLSVTTVITITKNPNDQVVVLGYKGQFTVVAEGESLKYQWQYKRPSGDTWYDTSMEGADRPTVFIETTKARDGYQYRCCITDVTGTVAYSEPATITVLSLVKQPEDAYAPVNGTVTFTVEASAEEGFTYQWQYRRNATANWTNTSLTGYNTATLTVGATKARNGYQYRCVLTGAKNSKLESNAVTLYVSEPVAISQQPQSVTVSASEKASFTVVAENVLSYQWYYKRPTGTVWSKTSAEGNKTATVTVDAKGKNGYQYKCVMQGMDGQEYTTDIATLTLQ